MNSVDNRSVMPLPLLENYRNDTQTIESLRYALNHAAHVSPDDMIDAINFAHTEGIGTVTGHISDKTAYIALHYQQEADSVNKESNGKLAAQLWDMEQERERLHFYVSLLEPRQETAVRLYYMEGKSREEVAEVLNVAVRTFHKIRKNAIRRLTEMYDLTSGLDR